MIDPDPLEPTPSAIGRLIVCDCGHGIGAHAAAGCRSERLRACGCPHDPAAILNRAIDIAARELAALMPANPRRPRASTRSRRSS